MMPPAITPAWELEPDPLLFETGLNIGRPVAALSVEKPNEVLEAGGAVVSGRSGVVTSQKGGGK